MNTKKEIERHKLPCGPVTVSIDGTCRRRLRDHFDALLDRLTKETHPSGIDEEILQMEEQVDIPEEPEQEETDEEKKERMIQEGKLKVEAKKEIAKYEQFLAEQEEADEEDEGEPEETDEEKKKRMIEEGKLRVDVKKAVSRYEDKVMGNSKMLQNSSGKIKKR